MPNLAKCSISKHRNGYDNCFVVKKATIVRKLMKKAMVTNLKFVSCYSAEQ